MAKKNRKVKKIFEEIEPFEPEVESTESDSSDLEAESVTSESNPPDTESAELSGATEEPSAEEPGPSAEVEALETPGPEAAAGAEEEPVGEDLLEDVRQSLIEEESQEKEKRPRWWRRIIKGRKKEQTAELEMTLPETQIQLPVEDTSAQQVEEQEESEEYVEQIDELIEMFEPASEEETPVSQVQEEATVSEEPVEPVRRVDIEELKKQAFRPSAPGEEAESFSEVRSIALEGDEEVFVEVESKVQDPMQERLKAFENAIKPYRQYINIAFAFLGVVMAVIAGLLLYNFYQQVRPQETPAVVSNLPYPSSVSLPGGWTFSLGKGTLQDGQWNPQGAEWLEGTEVCRWVALPWSRQLEAVIRTLNPDDQIELVMSNNDRLVYKVYSVRQLSSEELLNLDSSSPCLLVVLVQPDSDSRWVLTALP